ELSGGVLEMMAPSDYVKGWLSSHYMELLTAATREVLGPEADVRLLTDPSGTAPAHGPGDSRRADGAPALEHAKNGAGEAGAPKASGRRGRKSRPPADPGQGT